MFDFLYSEEKKVRGHAGNWLEVAERVYHFRRDLLTPAQLQQLEEARRDLKKMTKDGSKAPALRAGIERLEKVVRACGGRHYPVSSTVENVEFFLVAAIVILGLRAYFVQPFKIPTNSMWPTYYGMTEESFAPGAEPGPFGRLGRLVGFGAVNHTMIAPADGEVLVPIFENSPFVAYSQKPGRTLYVFPTVNREYTLMVDGEPVRVQVPADFSGFDAALDDQFGQGRGTWRAGLKERIEKSGRPVESSIMNVDAGSGERQARVYWVPLGKTVHKGERILSFDVMTGDLLFVDRVTYNFFQPKIGQGFVFKTENIHSPQMERPAGVQIKSYYIKRLVGVPGDTLEVKSPVLLRNGKPIEGAEAFRKNAERQAPYTGYTNTHDLDAGLTVTVPDHAFYAMGDNSSISADSRYWGFVPDKEVVGRPLFIYYPLTSRWGPAR